MDEYHRLAYFYCVCVFLLQDQDEAHIVLSIKWIKSDDELQKGKRLETRLEKMLQTWFNKCKHKVDCSVERMLKDGHVVIKTKPVPGAVKSYIII